MLNNIQYLRGIAALLVAVGHNLQLIQEKVYPHTNPFVRHFEHAGAIGVDIFFVISGFIMLYISGQEPAGARSMAKFWGKRLVRVMPTYWILTTAVLAFYLTGIPKSTIAFSLDYIGRSYLLLPVLNLDGNSLPILHVGWTLIYEMFFYFLFGLVLLARSAQRVWGLTAVMTGLVLAGVVLPTLRDESVVFWMYTSPLLLEFLFGIWIAKLWMLGYCIPKPLAWVLLVVAFGLLAYWFTGHEPTRSFWSGIPAAIVVASALSLESVAKAKGLIHRGLKVLGDASYSLYLVHAVLLYGISFVVRRMPIGTLESAIAVFVFAAVIEIAAAIVFFRLVEAPLTEALQRRFFKRQPLAGAVRPA
jgi:exopolysaccharide production protein ExoZ